MDLVPDPAWGVAEEEPTRLGVEVQSVAGHPHAISAVESNHRHGGVRILHLDGLVHVVQRVRGIGPRGVAHRHEGGVPVFDDLHVVAIVQNGQVLVVEPGVLGVLHRTGLGDDFRTNEHIPVAQGLLKGVFEGTVEVGRLHGEGAVLDGLVKRVDQRDGHAAVLVVEVLVEVHAGIEPAELPSSLRMSMMHWS